MASCAAPSMVRAETELEPEPRFFRTITRVIRHVWGALDHPPTTSGDPGPRVRRRSSARLRAIEANIHVARVLLALPPVARQSQPALSPLPDSEDGGATQCRSASHTFGGAQSDTEP